MDYFNFNTQLPSELGAPNMDPILQGELLTGVSFQIPTSVGTPAEHQASNPVIVSVSTTFHPGANINNQLPDVILVSSDNVFFHVHCCHILGASENGFNSLLPPNRGLNNDSLTPMVMLPEPAPVLNVVLHTIYNMSASQFAPSFDDLTDALDALIKYCIPVKHYVAATTPLFALLLSHAPMRPIDSYALAAHHGLEDLAVAISPHLLSFSLPSLSDSLAARIGSVYLKRLFFLHYGRMEALKGLLLHPPSPHPETPDCDTNQQQKLTRVWALASAHLVWDARPNLSTSLMQTALSPLENELTCQLCRRALRQRIQRLVAEWSSVKRTI
ncbi:hypothetical protein AcV7_004112 [Taiwanofungus camphoratus]|nr:hypothetical protein AcV7_004112 [Antrodia cinnamomea]